MPTWRHQRYKCVFIFHVLVDLPKLWNQLLMAAVVQSVRNTRLPKPHFAFTVKFQGQKVKFGQILQRCYFDLWSARKPKRLSRSSWNWRETWKRPSFSRQIQYNRRISLKNAVLASIVLLPSARLCTVHAEIWYETVHCRYTHTRQIWA